MKKLYLVRTIILAGSLLLQLSTLCFHSRGAAGDVDLSFDPGSGVNGTVNAVAVQADGKVLIGGKFTMVKGLVRYYVARLNADGSGDSTFDAGPDYYLGETLNTIALQPDGKIFVGDIYGIKRLNPDGSLDPSFDATFLWLQGYPNVRSIAVQPDGKVIIGGDLHTTYDANPGTGWNHGITRLNADGSLDSTFQTGRYVGGGADGVWGFVYSVALQPDGKVLVGGSIGTNYNDVVNRGIVRLNSNGSRDESFSRPIIDPNSPGGTTSFVQSLLVQLDGKVVFGGAFTTVNGASRNRIARVNANGTLDIGFDSGAGVTGGFDCIVESVALQSDGKVLFGGIFTAVSGTGRNGIARLNADGSHDGSFDPGTGANSRVSSVVGQPDGKALIGGGFTGVNGTNRNRIARLNANGSLDSGFNPGRGLDSPISSLAVQPDGKVLIGGPFTFINGTNRYGSARLNADGSADSTFVSSSFNPDLAFVIQTEDCLGGPDFECSQSWVTSTVLVQADRRVLIGGYSSTYVRDLVSGEDVFTRYRSFLARVHADGSRDASFAPVIGGLYDVRLLIALAVQPDGKLIVGGRFPGLVRRNTDGSLDNSFNPGDYPGIRSIALQADGRILIAGGFSTLRGTNVSYGIARLHADGTLDSSFDPGPGSLNYSPIALQPDGKVIIAGELRPILGAERNRLIRLNADGSPDLSFNPGVEANGTVRAIALSPDGNILIGGDFTTVNGVVRPYVARLYGDLAALPSLNIARSNASVTISWPATSLPFQLQETTNLALPNSWSLVAQPAVTNAGQISVNLPTAVGSRFFRLESQ